MMPFNNLGFVFKHFGSLVYSKEVLEDLCLFLKPFSNEESVLDVGAGTGVMSEFAYRCNGALKFTAVDPAEGMLKYAPEYLETHVGTAEALPFENDSFDAVFMGESLHHFHDIDAALAEVVRVLKDDGRLFIYDFDRGTFLGKCVCFMERVFGEPANFYEPSVLKEELESHGFSVTVMKHGWRYTVSASL
ncbi:MAG: SAM-dependent methyltransferase [Sulfurimonas sp. RIFCSPLOWO2_12_FULL_36_74]|uniref:class I SAM-dependent methyltransferase n=1 Tax=Sulfurimonas sp. RIFCSPLOWO2_12_36_12 TaxID=1802253 RepID=UPI0008D3C5A3|nr:class I SAM-dependent methyltransferase [Sulfurimonas sp. RIFCSPLOWO2_12_36_12]OHD98067.1 MAG: SAM-dependent methyltransferase [Sulfurimonas sp. RIFCSPLOWO2_02_FULL_36_28]OHE02885.1 MAG: SAM-dependent methyltransferase [Sulfurimonas sp. RIFCSPLOWO2_12_36_12]OHE07079.1 MAG: SAM-dependent methyltransferase [Sulfurimonas sp. RIFCSPLOWO2_12_FULL_36_74]